MKSSCANVDYIFNKEKWVVSIINTRRLNTAEQIAGGHAVMLIEGYNSSGDEFIRLYDIRAKPWKNQNDDSILEGNNKKGYISEIRHFDTLPPNINDYQANSFYITPEQASQIIKLVKADKKQVNAYNSYLALSKDEKDKQHNPPEPLLYQLFGKDSPFTNENNGDNCAGWCLNKLKTVGVDVNGVKPKPSIAANKNVAYLSQCAYKIWKYRYPILAVGAAVTLFFAHRYLNTENIDNDELFENNNNLNFDNLKNS